MHLRLRELLRVVGLGVVGGVLVLVVDGVANLRRV